MRDEYDFSQAKRAKEISHLARLQREARDKTSITLMLDNEVLAVFQARAKTLGVGYQTLINSALRDAIGSKPVDEATLRRVLREELKSP